VLNLVTTTAMIRCGKVYDNLMVDLRPVNRKLIRRAVRLVERVGEVGHGDASRLLGLAGDDVKAAIVMARLGIGRVEALRLLAEEGGVLRAVIDPQPGESLS
ncbi:MAG: N-acetylmuramic acid 6-phosphate etherase, partial [Thermoanaerobaculia bacterium]